MKLKLADAISADVERLHNLCFTEVTGALHRLLDYVGQFQLWPLRWFFSVFFLCMVLIWLAAILVVVFSPLIIWWAWTAY